ncbi:MAG: hypothetical protein Q7S23_02265 [bacterium]|nr:hypothetical protein [bacterium]
MALTARRAMVGGRGVAAAVLVCSVLLSLLVYWQHDGSSDAGTTLTTAWQMSQGKQLYRDIVDFYPPVAFALLAGVFKIFGPSYLAAKAVFLGLLIVCGLLVQRATRDFLPAPWRVAVLPLWLVFFAFYALINHNPLSLWLAALAWVSWSTAQRTSSRGFALLAGLLAGAASGTLQTKGIAVLMAAVVIVAIHQRKVWRLLPWLGMGFAAVLFLLFTIWPPALLWELLVAVPANSYAVPPGRLEYGLITLAAAVQLVSGWQLLRQRAPIVVWGWWWLGVMLLASTAVRTDAHHVVMNSFPLLPVALWIASQRRWKKTRGMSQVLDRMLATLVVAYPLTLALLVAAALPSGWPVAQGRTFWEWLALRNRGIEAIVFAVQTRVPPGKPIYAGPFLANAYFETQRENPTRFNNLITGLYPPEYFQEARASLEKQTPAVVLLNYPLVAKYRHQINNPVDAFFWSRYRVTAQFGDTVLLELQQPSGSP